MKVGTDGVLLGAWFSVINDTKSDVETKHPSRILDAGTGCGLIALMAAQRTGEGCHIDAIDIDKGCIEDAAANIANSPWRERISLYHTSFDDFVQQSRPALYDRIISNPPYFTASLLPSDSARAEARHTLSLSLRQLVRGAAHLLRPDGLLAVVLPSTASALFLNECHDAGLGLHRRTDLYPFLHAPAKRVLLEMEFGVEEEEVTNRLSRLVIHGASPGEFTPEYRALTGDFYLKF